MADDFVDFTFTDADGQLMRLYMLEDGGAVLRWPSGHTLRFNKELFDRFMDALATCVRENKPMTIDINQWLH